MKDEAEQFHGFWFAKEAPVKERGGMNAKPIPRVEIPLIADAIRVLVNRHGHPDEIPIGSLAECGIDPAAAEMCEVMLTNEDFPSEPHLAVAKWLRMIGEFSE